VAARCQELRSLLFECCMTSGWQAILQGRLPGAAGSTDSSLEGLCALREERTGRATALSGEAERSEEVLQGCNAQVKASSDSFRLELESLRERREGNDGVRAMLLDQKRELLRKLGQVDEQLDVAEKESRELVVNERRLEENMRHVSEELAGWLTREARRQEDLVEEQNILVGISEVALDVEKEIQARASAAASAREDCDGLVTVAPALAAACVQAESRRLLALEAMTSAAMEAPAEAAARAGTGALMQSEEEAWAGDAACHEVLDLVELAERDVVQLASELWHSLGLTDRSTPIERLLFDDALGLRDRCKALAGGLRGQLAPPATPDATASSADASSGSAAVGASASAGHGGGTASAPKVPPTGGAEDVAEDDAE